MNFWSRLFACLALSGLAFGAVVTAQDKDKEIGKDEKKEDKDASSDEQLAEDTDDADTPSRLPFKFPPTDPPLLRHAVDSNLRAD